MHNFEDISKELISYGADPYLKDEVILILLIFTMYLFHSI